MVKVKHWINSYWLVGTTTFVSFVALLLLLLIHIKSLNPGYDATELTIHNHLVSHYYGFHYLWHNLVNFPYTLGLVVADKLHRYSLLSIRIVGSLFGFLAAVLFFCVTYKWYEKIAAILGTILFVANFWFLENTRSGQSASLYPFVLLVIIGCIVLFNRVKKPKYLPIALAIILSLSLYVAGIVWFIALGLILKRKNIISKLKEIPLKIRVISGVAGLIFILPLAWYVYNAPGRLRYILGIPVHLASFKTYLMNFLKVPIHLFVLNNNSSYLTIGRLPMIDIFGTVLFLLGIYWFWTQYRFKRSSLLGVGLLVGWVISSLGIIPVFILYPFIMLFIASGILYLLSLWFKVFPTNPFARSTGVIILTAAILILAFYHINQYYIVWPHTPATLAAYSYSVK